LLLVLPAPAGADTADAWRVVLELSLPGLIGIELGDHHDVVVAACWYAVRDTHLIDFGAVIPLPRRTPTLGVVLGARGGLGLHGDARPRLLLATQPGWRIVDLTVVELLGVLAEIPDRPRVILGVVGELDLLHLPIAVVALPRHAGLHSVNHLGQVTDCEIDLPLNSAAVIFVEGVTLPLQPGPRGHGEVLIGDLERVVEVLRIEVGVGCRLRLDRGCARNGVAGYAAGRLAAGRLHAPTTGAQHTDAGQTREQAQCLTSHAWSFRSANRALGDPVSGRWVEGKLAHP